MELEKDVSRGREEKKDWWGHGGRGTQKEQEAAGVLFLPGRPWTPH